MADLGTMDRQAPRAAAAILSTTLGAGLLAAARSVFAQDLGAPIQLLVAILARDGTTDELDRLRADCPAHVLLTIADSGLPGPGDEDALYVGTGMTAAALAFLANSRYVAFLDDRHRWREGHLSSLRRTIEGHSWASALRCVLPPAGPPVVEPLDVVPDSDRSNLIMVDKQRHAGVLTHWSRPRGAPATLDLVQALRAGGAGAETSDATVTFAGPAAPRRPSAPVVSSASGASSDLAAAIARWRSDAVAAVTNDPLRPALLPHLPRLMDRIRPTSAIVLGAEADAVALSVALVATRLGLSTMVAAIDPFLGSPDDLAHDERRAALPRLDLYPLLVDRLRQAIRRFGLTERLVPIAAAPAPILADLAAAGVRVDLAHAELATDQEDFLFDLDALWPVIGEAGVIFGRIGWPDRIGREMQIRRWAARVGASISLAPEEGGIGKATVALRRR